MNARMYEQSFGRTPNARGQTDRQIDGRTDGRIDIRTHVRTEANTQVQTWKLEVIKKLEVRN